LVFIFRTGGAFLGAAGTFSLVILVVFGETILPTSVDPTDFLTNLGLVGPFDILGLATISGDRIIFINRHTSSDR
jgi:hypothetical protein